MTKLYIDAEANDHPVNEHPRLSGHKQAVISLSDKSEKNLITSSVFSGNRTAK